MQNRYVGDIGDFGKYGLLTTVFSAKQLRLGINWYLTDPNELKETSRNDGKHTEYDELRNCDDDLYETLQFLIKENKRTIEEVENRNIFPKDTIFYNNQLSFNGVSGREARLKKRKDWEESGLQALKDSQVVFFDPDNGLEVKSYSKTSIKGIKYAFYGEVARYYEKQKSLIIYQHWDKRIKESEYRKRIRTIYDHVKMAQEIFYLMWNPFPKRCYVFVLQEPHKKLIMLEIKKMLSGKWGEHFSDPHFLEK